MVEREIQMAEKVATVSERLRYFEEQIIKNQFDENNKLYALIAAQSKDIEALRLEFVAYSVKQKQIGHWLAGVGSVAVGVAVVYISTVLTAFL